LRDDRGLQFHLAHGIKSRIQPFADVLIWRVWKFIYQTHDDGVSGEAFLQDIVWSDMSR
jgi:hypothetical protein